MVMDVSLHSLLLLLYVYVALSYCIIGRYKVSEGVLINFWLCIVRLAVQRWGLKGRFHGASCGQSVAGSGVLIGQIRLGIVPRVITEHCSERFDG